MVKLDLSRVSVDYKTLNDTILKVNEGINNRSLEGSDFLGWVNYVNELDTKVVNRINEIAKKVQDECEYMVVIGIGGSYLGAKAAIDAINGVVNDSKVKIIFLGNTLSPTYTAQVIKKISGKKFAINVISKSGTTTEPAIAFRLCLNEAKKVWGNRYNEYVYATTDAARGALFTIATNNNFEKFIIPDDVGGRYSVFTPVGLLPMAVAGLNINAFLDGAKDGVKEYANTNIENNPAYQYGATRYLLNKNYGVEFLISYEPHLCGVAEWFKQLFGESEGKDGKGILPGSLCFSTDLHSMGQFCQEGTNMFFETTLSLDNYQDDIEICKADDNLDNLDYLVGKKMSFVNDVAKQSTIEAHSIEGKRENIVISLDKMDEYNLGNLMYFFCKACAMSAYLLEVNPFNQPGVEIYKARMKSLLKK